MLSRLNEGAAGGDRAAPRPVRQSTNRRPRRSSLMESFKVKLVLYFALLALVPAAVVFRAFQTVTSRGETRSVDARLQAELRAARATYDARVARVGQTARDLAASDAVQRA